MQRLHVLHILSIQAYESAQGFHGEGVGFRQRVKKVLVQENCEEQGTAHRVGFRMDNGSTEHSFYFIVRGDPLSLHWGDEFELVYTQAPGTRHARPVAVLVP